MWRTFSRPKPFGKKRLEREDELARQYGKGMWREAWIWGANRELTIPIDIVFLIYEDSYYNYFREKPKVAEWLASYKDVYDTTLSNVNSRYDYFAQEDPNVRHIQDISIRRALLRVGISFAGERFLEVRRPGKRGYFLTPGKIPFHMPEYIINPHLTGWWKKDSVEDFYQSNRVLQARTDK